MAVKPFVAVAMCGGCGTYVDDLAEVGRRTDCKCERPSSKLWPVARRLYRRRRVLICEDCEERWAFLSRYEYDKHRELDHAGCTQ